MPAMSNRHVTGANLAHGKLDAAGKAGKSMKSYHRNPRQITKKQLDHLADTLSRLGDLGGIVHNITTDEIIGGNQRARVFGEKSGVEIIEKFDKPDEQGTIAHGFILWNGHKFSYRQVSWDEATSAEANMTANASGGTWDWDVFANQWDAKELDGWLNADTLRDWKRDTSALDNFIKSEQVEPVDAEPQVDRAAELNEKWQVVTGDLWQIGEHRLLCGDSTVRADVERVMGGEKADIVFIDPPYGVNYEGGAGNEKKREKLEGDKTGDLYTPILALCKESVKKSSPMYVWFADRCGKPVYDAVEAIGYEVRAMIIWNKLDAHYGAFMAQYMQKHEPCLYIVDGNSNFIGASNEVTVWDLKQPSINEFHPTQKPVELAVRAIGNHDAPIVIDFCAGSGTTLVACQNLQRKCRAIEISESYCAVILERMSTAFPALKIERLE
jgi:DNA modification methylase